MSRQDGLMLGMALLFLVVNGLGAGFTIAGRSRRMNAAVGKKGVRKTHRMPVDRAL